MDRSTSLLYSYVIAARRYEATRDPGYKKTLGMFRQRLHTLGIRVISLEEDEAGGSVHINVHIVVNGDAKIIQLTVPA